MNTKEIQQLDFFKQMSMLLSKSNWLYSPWLELQACSSQDSNPVSIAAGISGTCDPSNQSLVIVILNIVSLENTDPEIQLLNEKKKN